MNVVSIAMNGPRRRPGITLTEILISIMIMGIGMVSLATLFPLGLLKLRDAARFSRSAYLAESASSDLAARGLLNRQSFQYADSINVYSSPLDNTVSWTYPYWYASKSFTTANVYNPFFQDTPSYGGDPFDVLPPNTTTYYGARGASGQGLPFAYDPLWRWQTGIYPDPVGKTTIEARFASGIGFLRADPDTGLASAHGLQRLTNFNRPSVTPFSNFVASVFVSPEDMVWQDASHKLQYPMAGSLNLADPVTSASLVDTPPSPLVPDLSQDFDANNIPLPLFDWRYTWMFTGRQISGGSAGATISGDIVIFENRPFGIDVVTSPIDGTVTVPQVAGERVVEAVFGYSGNGIEIGSDLNGSSIWMGNGASKTVLLRWPASTTDPEIKVGSWIADVTYERNYALSQNRFAYAPNNPLVAPSISGQRCHWYQVSKVNPPAPAVGTLAFGSNDGVYRYMLVNVSTPLRAVTPLSTTARPIHVNAALVSPHVIQVIPRTFTVN